MDGIPLFIGIIFVIFSDPKLTIISLQGLNKTPIKAFAFHNPKKPAVIF